MKDNSGFLVGLLVGAAAATALSVFISSDKGQEIVEDLKDAVDKAEKDLKKAIEKLEDKISTGKEYAGSLEKKAAKYIKQRTS